jgi:hypothetical protein
MFNFFKRSAPAGPKTPPAAVRKAAPAGAPHPQQPALPDAAPLPDVVEGNEHSDWALWEDSVNVLDSQMQGLTPSARIYERDKQTPSELQDLDPFAGISKRSR